MLQEVQAALVISQQKFQEASDEEAKAKKAEAELKAALDDLKAQEDVSFGIFLKS